jgi:hypothetical protein
MWQVVIHPNVLADLLRQRIHPLDRITLRDRLRGLRKRLLQTRGSPPDTAPADHLVPGCVRFVFDRLDCLFTVHPVTRRSWKWLWRRRVVTVINIISVRLLPHQTAG